MLLSLRPASSGIVGFGLQVQEPISIPMLLLLGGTVDKSLSIVWEVGMFVPTSLMYTQGHPNICDSGSMARGSVTQRQLISTSVSLRTTPVLCALLKVEGEDV